MTLSFAMDRSAGPRPAALLLLSVLGLLVLAAGAMASSKAVDLPEQVTFSEHVAPVFFENCVTCHRADDVAPMSLLSYAEARPWAKAIRKQVTEREMPPWDADPRYGRFANDISLSDREVALIERWVEQGAQEGDRAVMPNPPRLPVPGSWKMGRQPDLVLDLAEVDVAADGPDVFVSQFAVLEVPAGKWVQAIELLPGNTNVLHHVVTYLGPFGSDQEEESNSGINRVIYLDEGSKKPAGMAEAPAIGGVWVAGSPPTLFPKGMGHPLKTKQRLSLNMHYHPSGTAGSDASKLGFYFGEGELQKVITTAFAADVGLVIPAGEPNHREDAIYRFHQDSKILSLLPHMHNRGKAMKYTLVRPGGDREVLLDVPEYDYDWQNIYRFEEPIAAPAGSFVEVEAAWDNSDENPVNPDPTIEVPWGDGTNNEMMVAFVDFVVDDGQKPKPVRASESIAALLARHEPDRAYAIQIDGMGFGGPTGLVLPDQGDTGEGEYYVTLGSLMFSTSIDRIEWVDGSAVFNAALITSGGGTSLPIGFIATKGDGGTVSGEVFFGRTVLRRIDR